MGKPCLLCAIVSVLIHRPQRYIRGSGLAYGAYVSADLEAGHLSFSLYRVSSRLLARTSNLELMC